MDNPATPEETFPAIMQTIRDSGGLDEWNLRFQQPVLREVYRLAAAHVDEDTCRAHALPTWAAIAEAEQRSAQEGHPAPAAGATGQPEPWTKTTGEAL